MTRRSRYNCRKRRGYFSVGFLLVRLKRLAMLNIHMSGTSPELIAFSPVV